MKNLELNLEQKGRLVQTAKALSSEVRLNILHLLCRESHNINEIAEQLGIPQSSTVMNIRILEEAGLIETELQPGIRGSMKVCCKKAESILIKLEDDTEPGERCEIIRMPVGNFVDYKAVPTCGIVSDKGHIDEEDEPRCFYNPARTSAKLIWLGAGYLEYRFPNYLFQSIKPKRIELSAELCAEDHEYNMDYPSDITLWVNGREAGTWNCPGDFGGRRGKLNPDWWPDKNTQYGELKTWVIDEEASYLDKMPTGEPGIAAYGLQRGDYVSVRIGMKEDAGHIGGMNLFGDCFGDYPQDILMKVYY